MDSDLNSRSDRCKGAFTATLQEGSVDGSKDLSMFSSVDVSSGACFIMEDIGIRLSSIE